MSEKYEIRWEKTVIGGQTAPGDWVAIVEGVKVGRLYWFDAGKRKGYNWSFYLGHSDFRGDFLSGFEEELQPAADKIKAAFWRFVSYPGEKGGGAGKTPEQWRHGYGTRPMKPPR